MGLPPSPQAALRRLVRRLPLQPALHSRVFADGDVEPEPRRARSRWGRKTVPGASMMLSRCDASASANESSICGKRRPNEHAVCRLREQFKSDAFEGAHDIDARLA